ncbi:hypothetical protein ACU686_22295 [Yinghuangia aomiensis]
MTLVAVHTTRTTPTRADVLRLAGALEHASEHPIAQAVAAGAAAERAGNLPDPEDFANVPGLGRAGHRGQATLVLVGRAPAAGRMGPRPAARDLERAKADAEAAGRTAVAVAWDGEARADPGGRRRRQAEPRRRGIRRLQSANSASPRILLTGDNAGRVARGRRRARSASTDSVHRRGDAAGQGRRGRAGCRAEGRRSSRHGRRRRQRRARRSPRPTSGRPWAPAPTPRIEAGGPDPGTRRPSAPRRDAIRLVPQDPRHASSSEPVLGVRLQHRRPARSPRLRTCSTRCSPAGRMAFSARSSSVAQQPPPTELPGRRN